MIGFWMNTQPSVSLASVSTAANDADIATVKDDQGRHANLLKVPATSGIGERALTPMVEATERQADRSPALAQGGIVASSPISSVPPSFKDALAGSERRSGTPITQVANTAAEVADTAAKLDKVC